MIGKYNCKKCMFMYLGIISDFLRDIYDGIQEFLIGGYASFVLENKRFFLSYNLNELKNISRSVDLEFFILTSNLQSCCSENFGVRQEEKGGSGTPGTFLLGPPPRDLPLGPPPGSITDTVISGTCCTN